MQLEENRTAIIENTRHQVEDGWCSCDKALNSKSWNTTSHLFDCEVCKIHFKEPEQLKLDL